MIRDAEIQMALRQRDVRAILQLMFRGVPPALRKGYYTETELWDFKSNCPPPSKTAYDVWADLSADVLAFHNLNGGLLFFGISDDFRFVGATERLDSKLFNDQIRKFLSDRIWVDYHREFIQEDQRYLGVALVPPRGPVLERFISDGPIVRSKQLFRKGDAAQREGDSSKLIPKAQADVIDHRTPVPTIGRVYAVDEPFFRILHPDYTHFVKRDTPCSAIEEGLTDDRVAVTSIVGIGGVGKTTLATWAVLRAYERKQFEFIVSITAKDRELTSTGIRALQPGLTSFESLLDNTLEVLGFREKKTESITSKEGSVRELLSNNRGLLFIDNLETVDDARVIRFLDTLPARTKAIITSRRTTVRTLVKPVDLGPLTPEEVDEFIKSLECEPALRYTRQFAFAERMQIGDACDRIPLAIRWTLSRAKSVSEAFSNADSITESHSTGDEVLEFCFRRIFENMSQAERALLQVLALFQRPIPRETILVGADLPQIKFSDAEDALVTDALLHRLFDPEQNDYAYTVLPIARAFVQTELVQHPHLAERMRTRLFNWYEAIDVKDPEQRLVVRELRQGKSAPELALLDIAAVAEKKGDVEGARRSYEQAVQRNGKSWRAAQAYADFCKRHNDTSTALASYERAAANAPSRGPERALIFREYGMLLRKSGEANSTDLAIENFEMALKETPNDPVAIHALATMYERKGQYQRVLELLKPLEGHTSRKTRELTLPVLIRAYQRVGENLRAAELRQRLETLDA